MVGIYSEFGYRRFYDPDSFYNYCKKYLNSYWIVATNLGFDLTCTFFKTKYWPKFDIISNGGFMLMGSCKELNIKFIDTLNWHKASLKQLGEIIKLPKLPHPDYLGKRKPESLAEQKEFKNYNKRDCEISYYFSLWFQEEVNKLGGELKITIASTALDIWKRKFNKKVIVKEDKVLKKRGIDKNIKDKIFSAYYGGRTETIKRGFYEIPLNYYDFNSLYPSVMVEALPLPNSVQYHEKGSIKDVYHRPGVSKVTVEHLTDELPLLPLRYNGKLTFPSGKFTGWYTHIEIRKAVENGYSLHKVHETVSYSLSCYPFSDYVNIFYAKRLKAKKNGSSEQLIFKLLMNSLYGKFGERKHQVVKHFDLSLMSDKEKSELNKLELKAFTFDDDGVGYATWDEECTSSHVLPIWPVYITAMARIKLWEKARYLDPIYMDTDSIVTEKVLESSTKLGELEKEYTISKAIFIKPKMYYMNTNHGEIVRMKGVPHATKEQFRQVLNNEKISYSKFVKLKEGIRRNIKVNSIINIDKSIDLEDNKRIWLTPFSLIPQSSTPLKISWRAENEKSILQNEICVTDRRAIVCENKSFV